MNHRPTMPSARGARCLAPAFTECVRTRFHPFWLRTFVWGASVLLLGVDLPGSPGPAGAAWAAAKQQTTTPAPASTPASAAAKSTDPSLLARLEALQRKAGKREHFVVAFDQEFWSALRKRIRKSKGTLEFNAPRDFRWEITSPDKEIYVNKDGKEFWKYTEATRHAQKLPPGSVELDFVDLVLKLSSLASRYDVAPWKAGPANSASGANADPARSDHPPATADGMLLLELTPKQEGGQEAVFLRVVESKAEVRELRIHYRNGNRTRIVFAPLEDKRPEPSRFTFTPPPGTAVDTIR